MTFSNGYIFDRLVYMENRQTLTYLVAGQYAPIPNRSSCSAFEGSFIFDSFIRFVCLIFKDVLSTIEISVDNDEISLKKIKLIKCIN